MHVQPSVVVLTELEAFEGVKSNVQLEYSVHSISRLMVTECLTVFPELRKDESGLLCVPTFQKAEADLVDYTKQADYEKNRLLQSFVQWGKAVCQYILQRNQWADCVDPCSGMPLLTKHGSSCYSEVDGMQTLLKYRLQQVGDCSVIVHPRWGTRVYPASIFTTAPLSLLLEAIDGAHRRYMLLPPISSIVPLSPESDQIILALGAAGACKRKREVPDEQLKARQLMQTA